MQEISAPAAGQWVNFPDSPFQLYQPYPPAGDQPRAIEQLVEGHETAARTGRHAFNIADDADDQATADLITQRLVEHEKTAWMLRSLLK